MITTVFVVFFVLNPLFINCYITFFKNASLLTSTSTQGSFYTEESEMWSKRDIGFGSQNYIDVDISVVKADPKVVGVVDVVLIDKRFLYLLGVNASYTDKMYQETPWNTGRQMCCIGPSNPHTSCKRAGQAIVRPLHDNERPFTNTLSVLDFAATGKIKARWTKLSTSAYYLVILNCPIREGGAGTLFLTGTIKWRNPYGWLKGIMYPVMRYSGLMAILYSVIFGLFVLLCLIYRKKLMKVQYAIALVMLVGIIEMSCWYFYYLNVNDTGKLYATTPLLPIIVQTFKTTISLTLVLAVSLGFGVVKWSLGNVRNKILVLSVAYFVGSLIWSIEEHSKHATKKSHTRGGALIILALIASLLNTAFAWWIFVALIRTIQQLNLRRQGLKLQMYRSFLGVLIITIGMALLIGVYKILYNNSWEEEWVWLISFPTLYFIVLTSIAWLWRPKSNNMRYGAGTLFDNEGNAKMTGVSVDPEQEKADKEELEFLDGALKAFSIDDKEEERENREVGKLD